MIVLFTDFGARGPYIGQVTAVLYGAAPGVPVIDLLADAPAFDPQASAYLLAAYARPFPAETVFLAVVDPGVGGERPPCVVRADDRWFVGPGNGLFELVMRRAACVRCWQIDWRPERLSATFHGRDLFAPVAARLALAEPPPGSLLAISGMRAATVAPTARVCVGETAVAAARTFCEVPAGQPFWYENADGLLEIAVNRGRAADLPGVAAGTALSIER